MSRKSRAELSVTRVDGLPNTVEPPATLPEPARTVFVQLSSSVKPGHFEESDELPLACYSQLLTEIEIAGEHLRKEGCVTASGKPSPWLPVREKLIRAAAVLARQLRLSPRTRRSPSRPRQTEKAPPSYYDFLRATRDEAT